MGSIDIKGSFSLFKQSERYISPVLSLESENNFKLLNDDDKNYDYLYKIANKSFYIENYNIALVNFIKLKSLKPDEIELDLKIAECYFGISY